MITSSQINEILGITESFQLHGALKGILFDKDKRLKIFKRFLEIENNLDYEMLDFLIMVFHLKVRPTMRLCCMVYHI